MGNSKLNKFQVAQRLKKISDMHLQGIEVEEIAKRLGVSEGTIYNSLKKQKKEWQETQQLNTGLVIAETLAEVDLLKQTYWDAWLKSKTPMQTKRRKVSQRENPKKKLKDGEEAQPQGMQNVEVSEETKEKEGNPQFLKGVEWCVNFKVELLGLKKVHLDIVGDLEVEIDA